MKTRIPCLLLVLASFSSFAADNSTMNMSSMASSQASQEYMSGMTMMHSKMMDGVKDPDPDKAFVKGMIAHHEGAIAMAETELKYGKDPEMRKLATDIIKAQKAEVAQMNKWLNDKK